MISSESINLLVAINAGTLISIILFGYKVITFLNQLSFKTDIMWRDYNRRIQGGRRSYDMPIIGENHED